MAFNEAHDDTYTSVDHASRLGNVVLLKELLQQGHPTNCRNNRGWRPLHEAAAGGHVECVRALLMADDAEVDPLTHDGQKLVTPLYLACEPGECYTEVVKLLLSAGANPNMKWGAIKNLPLPKAVFNNLYDIVKLLLDAGGNPNIIDIHSEVPLLAAVMRGNLKIAQLLVERGAKVEYHKNTAIIFVLLTPSHLMENSTRRHLMEDSTLISFIDLLVNAGLDVKTGMEDGKTPLMLAVKGNKIGVVSRLLELGADPNIKDNYGVLALHYAIKFWPDSSMEQHDGSNSEGETTEHVLRRILDLTSRKLVIPAYFQKKFFCIFHFAIGWDKFNTLKLMINAGLPPDAFLQETTIAAVDETFGVYCPDDVSMVKDLGIEVDTPLGFLLSLPLNEKRVKMAKFMIDKGSNVNVVSPRCLPPLVAVVKHQRARYNHGCPGLDILEHLLSNGVDVMHKISARDILPTALHISSLFNVQAFSALLIRCVPVHEIYTPWTLKSLSLLYIKSKYYKVYPLWPWRVISWLNVMNAFVPQLPLDMKNTFHIPRMVEDDNLSRAWNDLDAQIGSPKKLEQLCILKIRRVVGERRGWNRLTTFLRKVTLMNEPLPDLIMDLLTFKQMMESSCLSKGPPREVLSRHGLSAANSRNANSDDEDDPSDNDDEDDIEMMLKEAIIDIEDSEDSDDDDSDDDDNDNGNDGNCNKEVDNAKGAEEQSDDSIEEEEEEDKNKRKKIKMVI